MPCMILANATQIHQVLMNICSNAEYAMCDTCGMITVKLETVDVGQEFVAVHQELKPGPHFCLSIRDTGHVMTPEKAKEIGIQAFKMKPLGSPELATTLQQILGKALLSSPYGIREDYSVRVLIGMLPCPVPYSCVRTNNRQGLP